MSVIEVWGGVGEVGHDRDETPELVGVKLVVSHDHQGVGAPLLAAGGRSIDAQPRCGVWAGSCGPARRQAGPRLFDDGGECLVDLSGDVALQHACDLAHGLALG